MLLLAFSICAFIATVQSQEIASETWIDKPVLHTVDNNLKNESAILVFDKRRMEYIDVDKELTLYKTVHKIIHINDDKGIETFNKIYLPVTSNADIKAIKARTILPNGKIIELNEKNIKDLEEGDRIYKIFAMEGLEKGCEIEYYYTYKREVSFFGMEIFQARFPVMESRMELVTPKRLVFETRTFNSSAKPSGSEETDKKWTIITEKNIPGPMKKNTALIKLT